MTIPETLFFHILCFGGRKGEGVGRGVPPEEKKLRVPEEVNPALRPLLFGYEKTARRLCGLNWWVSA
jgi:hypothetical protein